MPDDARYSILDRPEILQFTFYPRRFVSRGLPNSTDYDIPVADGISIGCRGYLHRPDAPSILFFHGNGEVVSDYDSIAPLYNQRGINLCVADYRGYGSSGGSPTFTSIVRDAHAILKIWLDTQRDEGITGDVYVMGRSLGSICAIELASSYPKQIKGLIIESGFASILRLISYLGYPAESLGLNDLTFPNLAKMSSITMPTLILHGEFDSLIPVTEARDLFDKAAAKRKRLVIINGADHNDIMLVGMEQYFAEIRDFVSGNASESRL